MKRNAYALAIGALALFYVLIHLSSFAVEDAFLQEGDKSLKGVHVPFFERQSVAGDFVIQGKFEYTFISQSILRIIPDNSIKRIMINGVAVSLAGVPPGQLADYTKGFVLDLGRYCRYGSNELQVELANGGGPRKLLIHPTFSDPLFSVFVFGFAAAFLFLVYLLVVDLSRGILLRRSLAALCLTGLTGLAVVVRLLLVPLTSGDLAVFVSWLQQILDNGGFAALGTGFYDYTPFFPYMLAGLAPLNLPYEFTIKLGSIVFDVVAALFMLGIVRRSTGSRIAPLAAYLTFLFLPSVILNSSWWGQCDVIYTALLLGALSFVLKDRMERRDSLYAMVFFGLAFAFKQQAIFLAPLFLVMLLRRDIVFWHILAVPAVYLVMTLPALIAGRALAELLTIYVHQTKMFSMLTLGLPNLYAWLPNNPALSFWGILFSATTVLAVIFLVMAARPKMTVSLRLKLAFFFALLVPFTLPHMHERYYFLADALALVYAFVIPGRWYLPVFVAGTSFLAYQPFLFGIVPPISIPLLVIPVFAALIVTGRDIASEIGAGGRSVSLPGTSRLRYRLRQYR